MVLYQAHARVTRAPWQRYTHTRIALSNDAHIPLRTHLPLQLGEPEPYRQLWRVAAQTATHGSFCLTPRLSVSSLDLTGLCLPGVRSLIASTIGIPPESISDESVLEARDRSGGNPRFLLLLLSSYKPTTSAQARRILAPRAHRGHGPTEQCRAARAAGRWPAGCRRPPAPALAPPRCRAGSSAHR